MRSRRTRIALILGAALAAWLAAAGCGGKLHALVEPRPAPVATLRVTRLATASADSAVFALSWSGSVTRGRIDHYLVALNPRSLDASDPAWQATRETGRTIRLGTPAAAPGDARAATASAQVRLVFALRAVDEYGVASAVVMRALSPASVPPTVTILNPLPSSLFYQLVPPSVLITWTGNDPDGVFTQKPVKYKYRLFKDTDAVFGEEPPIGTQQFDLARSNPDSLRRYYAPGFAGFDSVGGDMESVQYLNLVTNSRYLFVLVGFDESGEYNQVFSLNSNMLQMQVSFAGVNGPRLTMWNEYFNYTYPTGTWLDDPSRYVDTQVPAGRPITFYWSAVTHPGALIRSYRWVLDPADLFDETPRVDENTDWRHWSQLSFNITSATIGPFNPPARTREVHRLYIEAEDTNGLKSLGIVRFRVLAPPFAEETSLLIVDDTRLQADQLLFPPDPVHPDSIGPPVGAWPTAAELDTFLLARGGVRWRMTPNGTLSPPGLFAGYHYDTVGTMFLTGGVVPLSMLNRYRHVLWLTDANSAIGVQGYFGLGALRQMCSPGQSDVLAAYARQGGQLWIAGGFAGYAATIAYNATFNDAQPPAGVVKFSTSAFSGLGAELTLGRFMYDIPHWQSGFYSTTGQFGIVRSFGAAGGWTGEINYNLLPAQIRTKSPTSDPVPPFRSPSLFYNGSRIFNLEYLSEPNSIVEDGVPDPVSKLDTLYAAANVPVPPLAPAPYLPACMTYYHGHDGGSVVFSGFNLWSFSRPDLIALGDFVLQEIWHLPRDPVARFVTPSPVAGRPQGQ